jgi:hypothetical protein
MIYLFVLVATATMAPASGKSSFQTVGYYATAAECQYALIDNEKKIDKNYIRLKCHPIKVTE